MSLYCEKNENKQKEAGFGPFLKKKRFSSDRGLGGRVFTSTAEVCGSNPDISKIYTEHLFTVNCIEKTTIKKKEAKNGPFKKTIG